MNAAVPRLCASAVGLALLLLVAPASAEVSVNFEPVTGRVTSVGDLRAITDDPDPVPLVWRPYHQPRPGLALLNPEGEAQGDGRASMAIHPQTGEALVAWAKNGPQGFDIVLSRFANGVWQPPVPLAQTALDEVDPVLLVDPATGTLHVLYWIDSASPRVMHTTAPASASPWSTPVPVSVSSELARRPQAVFHDGLLRVVYETIDQGYPSTPRQITLATLEAGGFTHSVVSVTHHGQHNWPQVHSKRSRMWVDWIDAEGELGWSLWSGTHWEPVALEVFTSPFDLEYHARGRVAAQALAPAP